MAWAIQNEEDKEILKEIYTQTDRGAALIAAAYLESRLTQAIKARVVRNEQIEKNLFRYPGALSAFAAKIDLGFLLGIYREKVHRDLVTIKEIRNRFAHRSEPLHFESEGIRALCMNIKVSGRVDAVTDGTGAKRPLFELTLDGTARTAFMNAVQYALLVLSMEIRTAPHRTPAPPVLPELATRRKASRKKP